MKIPLSAFLLPVFIFCSCATSKAPASPVWEKVDSLNQQLKPGEKALAGADFQRLIGEAIALVESDELELDYQTVREKAFSSNDFKPAEKLKTRAAPAFTFYYDGDYDVHGLNFDHFYSLTATGTVERRFLEVYRRYHHSQFIDLTKSGLGGRDCYLPFAKLEAEANFKPVRWKITGELNNLITTLPAQSYLRGRTETFVKCTKRAKPVKKGTK